MTAKSLLSSLFHVKKQPSKCNYYCLTEFMHQLHISVLHVYHYAGPSLPCDKFRFFWPL